MSAVDTNDQPMKRDNPFKRAVMNIRAQAEFARSHWLASLVYGAAVAVGGWVLADIYNAWKPWADNDDARLEQIRQEQATAFRNLDEQLGKLNQAVDGDGRDVLRDVEGLVEEIRDTNTGLLHQLVLARDEYARLSQVAGSQGGVTGGYDFILSENTGISIDPSTVVGVGNISGGGARVRVSANGMEGTLREFLGSGESIAFRNAGGDACRVTLLSVNEGAAASFDVACGPG